MSVTILDQEKIAGRLFWFAFGAALGITVMAAYGAGNWASLLRVGSANPLVNRITSELGGIPRSDPTGHDGQLYYLIARDPLGVRGTPEAIAAFDNNGPRYRYRRILFPVLAGGFGLLDGRTTLFGMIFWLAMAMGIATLAISDIACHLNIRKSVVFVAATNLGAFASLLLLTADALAVALGLAGVALIFRGRIAWAAVFFALATMTKEVYVLLPVSVAVWLWLHGRGTHAFAMFLAVVPVILWYTWTLAAIPALPRAVRNIGPPLGGLSDALPIWIQHERNKVELLLMAFITLSLAASAGMVVLGRNALLKWLIAPWIVLALLASAAVWGKPNNAARAFAILWPLSVLLLSERLSTERARQKTNA